MMQQDTCLRKSQRTFRPTLSRPAALPSHQRSPVSAPCLLSCSFEASLTPPSVLLVLLLYGLKDITSAFHAKVQQIYVFLYLFWVIASEVKPLSLSITLPSCIVWHSPWYNVMFPCLARRGFWEDDPPIQYNFIHAHYEKLPYSILLMQQCILNSNRVFLLIISLLFVCKMQRNVTTISRHDIQNFFACFPLSLITALHSKTQMQFSASPGAQSLPFDWRAVEKTSSPGLDVPLVATGAGAEKWKVRGKTKAKCSANKACRSAF